jgi:LPXTG-motif cell wall-anchored protein
MRKSFAGVLILGVALFSATSAAHAGTPLVPIGIAPVTSSVPVGTVVSITISPGNCYGYTDATIAYDFGTVADGLENVNVPGPLVSAGNISFPLTISSAEPYEITAVCVTSSSTVLTETRQTVTITGVPNAVPVAAAGATPTSGAAPLGVTFNSTGSSDSDGSIASYSWDFGDGSPAGTGAAPSHTYAAAGTYTAMLTVTDNLGATATANVTITVSAAPVVTTTTVAPVAPVVPVTTVAVTTTTRAGGSGAGLPSTGSNSGVLAIVAGMLLLAGSASFFVSRRHEI